MTIRYTIVAAIVLASANANADESGTATAQQLFKDGRAFLQQGKFADACDRLSRSDKIEPAVGTRLSLGECHEGLGQTASAWASYNQATALGMQRNDPRADVAKKRAAALEPKLARLTIRVTAKDPELHVRRNGAPVETAAFDTAMPVDAGPQTVEAAMPNAKPWSTNIAIHDGESREVIVPALEAEPAWKPRTDLPPEDGSRKALALGLEIGGGVAMLSGLVIGGVAISKWSSVEDTCPDGRCRTDAERDRLAPDVSTARTLATVSTVVTGLGAAALLAGIVIHLYAPMRVAVVPLVDPKTAGLAGSLSF